jgi:hypothetical protein
MHPERKQGKIRKARRNPKYGSPSCNHCDPSEPYTQYDMVQCVKLLDEFKKIEDGIPGELTQNLQEICCRYFDELDSKCQTLF